MSRIFKALTPNAARTPKAAAGRKAGGPVGKDKLEQAARDKKREAQSQGVKANPSKESEASSSGAGNPKEIGGPDGLEPTRYGDWERGGICYDF